MPKFKFIGGSTFHYKAGEEVLGHGDVIECSEEDISAHLDRFEKVESEAESDSSGSEGETSSSPEESAEESAEPAESESEGDVSPPFDPTELTVSEIEDRLDEDEFTEDAIDALITAESEGPERSTAVEALEEAK